MRNNRLPPKKPDPTATWVAQLTDGAHVATIYQRSDGTFFLRRPHQTETEPLTELEVRRFLTGVIERSEIEDACQEVFALVKEHLGVDPPPDIKRQIIKRTHKKARQAGVTRTGSAPDLTKFVSPTAGQGDDR
jgi:hypothetical protein